MPEGGTSGGSLEQEAAPAAARSVVRAAAGNGHVWHAMDVWLFVQQLAHPSDAPGPIGTVVVEHGSQESSSSSSNGSDAGVVMDASDGGLHLVLEDVTRRGPA